MAETTNVSKLIINYLTEDQYRTAKASGLINENELYVTDIQDSATLDCFEELFTATEGQTLFTLTEGTYQVGKNRLTICVNGAQQPSTAYAETSSSSFTFISGLSAGDSVIARYVNARIVSNIVVEPHKTNHYSGGTDPLTPSDIGAANASHTHNADMIVDGSTNKAFTATEKTKLAGIATGANNYTHPASHPASMVTQDANNRFVTDAEKAKWNGAFSDVFSAGTTAPTNTKLLWIDTNASTGGLKYYNGTTWVTVPVGYTS